MSRRSILPKIIYLTAIILIGYSVFGSHGVLQYRSLTREAASLELTARKLEQEVVQIQSDLEQLNAGGVALEQRAREELGLSRPDEIIYIEKSATRP